MVDHRVGEPTPPTLPRPEEPARAGLYTEPGFFPQWDELLAACEEWAISQGWRFSSSALLQVRPESPNYPGQARALPMALEYGDRIRGMQCFSDEPLLSEFRRCQELVAQEAVHNSMVATCRALGLWQEDAPVDEDCAWQDCSQPLEVITRRLQSHAAQVEAAGLTEKLSRRTRQASFIVEFGLEHGLPPLKDATSEATLTDFLERIKEWDGGHDNEMCVPALPARALPGLPLPGPGLAPSHARSADGHPRPPVAECARSCSRTSPRPRPRCRPRCARRPPTGSSTTRGRPSSAAPSLEACSASSLRAPPSRPRPARRRREDGEAVSAHLPGTYRTEGTPIRVASAP